MASSPTPPNHTALIFDTLLPILHDADVDHEDPSIASLASGAVRLSYESSPSSKIRKAVDHATPPSGGQSPRHSSRRTGDFSRFTLPFEPVPDDRHLPSLRPPSLDGASPNSIANPPLVSQSLTMDDFFVPVRSLAAVAAATASTDIAAGNNHPLRQTSIDGATRSPIANLPLVSQTQTMDEPMTALESLAAIAADTAPPVNKKS